MPLVSASATSVPEGVRCIDSPPLLYPPLSVPDPLPSVPIVTRFGASTPRGSPRPDSTCHAAHHLPQEGSLWTMRVALMCRALQGCHHTSASNRVSGRHRSLRPVREGSRNSVRTSCAADSALNGEDSKPVASLSTAGASLLLAVGLLATAAVSIAAICMESSVLSLCSRGTTPLRGRTEPAHCRIS